MILLVDPAEECIGVGVGVFKLYDEGLVDGFLLGRGEVGKADGEVDAGLYGDVEGFDAVGG